MNIGQWCKKILNPKPIDSFVSETDQFLEGLRKKQGLTPAQKEERRKYEKLAARRDKKHPKEWEEKIWRDF